MSGPRYINFDTLSLHAGRRPIRPPRARATPIYQTTSYVLPGFRSRRGAVQRRAARPRVLAHHQSTTRGCLEERVAALEGGVGAIATASGQAAMHLAIATIVGAGEHIVASSALYGGSHNLLSYTLPRFGIRTTFVNPRDPNAFRDAIRPADPARVQRDSRQTPGSTCSTSPPWPRSRTRRGSRCCWIPPSPRPGSCARSITARTSSSIPRPSSSAATAWRSAGWLVDGGTFDWDASERFPTLSEPYEGFHDLVFTEEYGPAAFIMRARKEGARDFGRVHESHHRVSHPAGGGDALAAAWNATSRTRARWSNT